MTGPSRAAGSPLLEAGRGRGEVEGAAWPAGPPPRPAWVGSLSVLPVGDRPEEIAVRRWLWEQNLPVKLAGVTSGGKRHWGERMLPSPGSAFIRSLEELPFGHDCGSGACAFNDVLRVASLLLNLVV